MPKKKLTPRFHHRLQLNKFQSKHLHVLQVNKGCGNTYVFGQIENYPIPQPQHLPRDISYVGVNMQDRNINHDSAINRLRACVLGRVPSQIRPTGWKEFDKKAANFRGCFKITDSVSAIGDGFLISEGRWEIQGECSGVDEVVQMTIVDAPSNTYLR